MPRPPLPIGTWGHIRTQVIKTDDKGNPASLRAQAKYRDHDGQTRLVSAFGKTMTAAKNNLLVKLKDRAKTSQAGELTSMHRVREAVALWEAKFEELVAEGQRSPSSLDTYRRTIKNHVLPAVGELRIGEANTPRIDKAISEIKKRAGAPTARTCRSILSGVMGLAVRYGAIFVNPVREVDRIEHTPEKLPRALTTEEPPTSEPCGLTCPTWSPSCSEAVSVSAKPWLCSGLRSTSKPGGSKSTVNWPAPSFRASTTLGLLLTFGWMTVNN